MLGSYLTTHGHEVRIIDLNVTPESQLDQTLESEQFGLVGISLRNVLPFFWLDRFRGLRELVRKVRDAGHDPVLGGPGFSLFAPAAFHHVPELNMGVLGEGEYALYRLAEGDDPREVPGVCVREEGGLHSNYPPKFLPGEEIPLYCELEGFQPDNPGYLVGVQTYRGCPHSCAYCPAAYLRGKSIRSHPLEMVYQDLEFLLEKGIGHLFFIDGVFHHDMERNALLLEHLCSREAPPSWEAFIKPGPDVTEKYLAHTVRAGAIRFHIDVITASERLHPIIDHDLSLSDTLRVAEQMRKLDLEGVFYFAYNLPTETIGEELEALRVMRGLRRQGHETYVYPSFAFPRTGFEKYVGRVLEKTIGWHIKRLIAMILRPSFLRFLYDTIRLDSVTGPRKP